MWTVFTKDDIEIDNILIDIVYIKKKKQSAELENWFDVLKKVMHLTDRQYMGPKSL